MADGIAVAREGLTAERADLQWRLADIERALQALGGRAAPRQGHRASARTGSRAVR